MRIQRQVIQSAIREAVAIISCILDLGNETDLGEIGDAYVRAVPAAKGGNLENERCRDDFVVFAALLDLPFALAWEFFYAWVGGGWSYSGEDAPVVVGEITDGAGVELHCDYAIVIFDQVLEGVSPCV